VNQSDSCITAFRERQSIEEIGLSDSERGLCLTQRGVTDRQISGPRRRRRAYSTSGWQWPRLNSVSTRRELDLSCS